MFVSEAIVFWWEVVTAMLCTEARKLFFLLFADKLQRLLYFKIKRKLVKN